MFQLRVFSNRTFQLHVLRRTLAFNLFQAEKFAAYERQFNTVNWMAVQKGLEYKLIRQFSKTCI